MAKKVQVENFERLYAQAQNFKNKAQASAENINRNIQYLTSPATLDGLRGGQGDMAVEAIMSAKISLEALATRVDEAGRFLDEKIAGAIQLRKDKNDFGSSNAKAKSIASQVERK